MLSSGQFLNFLGFLSGGALQRFSVIAMGITPYINASIIMQLATVVFPEVKELMQHGGEEGRKQVGLWTRWLTVVLALVQATTMVVALNRDQRVRAHRSVLSREVVVLTLTAGTVWLMWLGEQITDKGIGNGVSLIIFVGIILRYPTYFSETFRSARSRRAQLVRAAACSSRSRSSRSSRSSSCTKGQRRVPVQYAKRVVGRKVYGGRSTYIPLRLNNAGVISIIFAISILLLPQQISAWAANYHTPLADGFNRFMTLVFQLRQLLLQRRLLLAGRRLHVLL